MRFVILFLILFKTTMVFADCPAGDKIAREAGLNKAIDVYLNCALNHNDDDTQIYLAQIYSKGQGNIPKNIQRSLLFYHLSAENGNATAMIELANILTLLDANDNTRSELVQYINKMKGQSKTSAIGDLLHPYALLMLAAEKPENKWFYTTKTKSDPRALQRLQSYAIDSDKKQEIIKTATQWKQKKMLDAAYKVFSIAELNDFYKALYPKQGLPNKFTRAQAVEKLKEKIESRVK